VGSLTGQAITNILYGLARLQIKEHESFVCKLCAAACKKDFNPQEISNIWQALVALDYRDETLFQHLCELALKQVDRFNMQDVACTLNGLARFDIDNIQLVVFA